MSLDLDLYCDSEIDEVGWVQEEDEVEDKVDDDGDVKFVVVDH